MYLYVTMLLVERINFLGDVSFCITFLASS